MRAEDQKRIARELERTNIIRGEIERIKRTLRTSIEAEAAAAMSLEIAIEEAFTGDGYRTPSEFDDPVKFLIGGQLVTVQPGESRPDIAIEEMRIVSSPIDNE